MGRRLDRASDDGRRAVWPGAKLAVRSYARDPSESNTGRIRSARLRVRHTVTKAVDRRIHMELLELERRNRHR